MIKVQKDQFIKVVESVSRPTNKKTEVQIMENIKISVLSNSVIELVGSDSYISIKETINQFDVGPTKVVSFVVNGNLLLKALRKIKEDVIQLELSSNTLNLDVGETQIIFNTMNDALYPPIDFGDTENQISFDAVEFKKNVGSLIHATGKSDDAKYGGINFRANVGDPKISLGATDGYRMATNELNCSMDKAVDQTVPTEAIMHVLRLITNESKIAVTFGSKSVRFDIGDSIVSARILNGIFPNIERIIPKNHSILVEVDPKLFYNALDTSTIFAIDDYFASDLKIDSTGVLIKSVDSEKGSLEEKVSVENVVGNDLDIRVNAKITLQALAAFSVSKKIKVEFESARTPIFFTSNEETLRQLIMPLDV